MTTLVTRVNGSAVEVIRDGTALFTVPCDDCFEGRAMFYAYVKSEIHESSRVLIQRTNGNCALHSSSYERLFVSTDKVTASLTFCQSVLASLTGE